MFWESLQHYAEGKEESECEGIAGNAHGKLLDLPKSDWKCQESADGRQSRTRERKAGRLCFTACQVRVLYPWPYRFSLAPWCAVKPCLPACNAQQSPKLGRSGTLALLGTRKMLRLDKWKDDKWGTVEQHPGDHWYENYNSFLDTPLKILVSNKTGFALTGTSKMCQKQSNSI